MPKLNHSSNVMRDVANAINAGKEVTISERQIRAFGWNGTGYIVLDPDTGVGGYLIDGGKNGGFTQSSNDSILGYDFFLSLTNSEISIVLEPNKWTVFWIAFSTFSIGILAAHLSALIQVNKCLYDSQKSSLISALSSLSLFSSMPLPFYNPLKPSFGAFLGVLFVMFQTIHLMKINHAIGDC